MTSRQMDNPELRARQHVIDAAINYASALDREPGAGPLAVQCWNDGIVAAVAALRESVRCLVVIQAELAQGGAK